MCGCQVVPLGSEPVWSLASVFTLRPGRPSCCREPTLRVERFGLLPATGPLAGLFSGPSRWRASTAASATVPAGFVRGALRCRLARFEYYTQVASDASVVLHK